MQIFGIWLPVHITGLEAHPRGGPVGHTYNPCAEHRVFQESAAGKSTRWGH